MRSQIERHNSATRKLYDRSKSKDQWEFRGVDGEGGNVPDADTLFPAEFPRHQYLSLRVGPNLLETGHPLDYRECLDFLANQPARFIYVAYFFDYDVTMIIRTFPVERARRLINRHLRTTKEGNILPLDIGDFEVDYLPHKEFKVRRKGSKYWVVINDVGQFFQASFHKTLTRWNVGTEQERAFILKGKSMRADFAELTDEVRAYNALECLLLEQLMTEFRTVCWETGYVPKKWQGPGHLASAMLDYHGVPKRDDIPILKNKTFYSLAMAGYYGGRFETTASGLIRQPVYQYDINGAYVHMLRTLPCLTHRTWRRVHNRPDTGLWFGKISFTHTSNRNLYNLPFRLANGNIRYPREGNGVYWSIEIEAAERAGTTIQFKSGYVLESHCKCRWFDFVDDYYQRRLALGKTNKGYVLKLAGNSIYGKLAQSIGYAPWANPVWAGIITAGCRALLIDAYSQTDDALSGCLMLATDGIFSLTPLDLPISKELGEWEETIHPDGMFIIQPGIYFTNDEPKTRGVEQVRIAQMRQIFEAEWERYKHNPKGLHFSVKVPVDNFITAKQALARNKWQLAGTWEKTEREISFYWGIKRKAGIAFWRDGMLRTVPYEGDPDAMSIPYSRVIGGNMRVPDSERWSGGAGLEERERVSEQPDWVTPLLLASLPNRYLHHE